MKLTKKKFKNIIKEEIKKLHKRTLLENEKKNLQKELNIIFEAKFDIETSEIEDFLNKVKSENPESLSRFRSIIKNKGLDVANERYKEIDPEIIAQKKVELSKEKAKELRKKWYQKNKEKISLRKQKEKEYKKELIRKFVSFLPNDFPHEMKILANKGGMGLDGSYYMLIGAYEKKFEDKTGIRYLIDLDDEYISDVFEEMMYGRYGEEIEF